MNILKKNYNLIKKEKIYNSNVASLDIASLFKLEKNIITYTNELQINNKNLDLIYFKYYELKNKINNAIKYNKEILIKINSQKKTYDLKNTYKKLNFQKKLYKLLCYQTSKSILLEQIKEIENAITLLLDDLNSSILNNKFNNIKNKNKKNIIKIMNNKNDSPYKLSTNEKITWYENKIEEKVKIKMIFESYMFSLENLYKEIIEKKMSDITK